MSGIARLFTQQVTVETLTAPTSFGEQYAAPVTVTCFINDTRNLIRNGEGEQVVSETTLYAPLSTESTFAEGSRVTVNGRHARVLKLSRRDSAGPVNAHHVQVALT